MKGRRLSKEISRDELMNMRASGMTNSDIANALGICIQTVRNYIGAQPGKGGRQARYLPPPKVEHENCIGGGSGVSESAPACLVVTRREINLEGVYGKHRISSNGSSVTLYLPEAEEFIDMPVDKLPDFINELTAIMRNIPKLSKLNEAW